ncbi:MAG TPA: GNAT family N-acetyltransferase [Xanthobacteraceae bacterium]|jgi:putative acetyltransferase
MSASAHPTMAVRPFLRSDVAVLGEIFRTSIEELAADDYSDAQREAWVAAAADEEAFGTRLASQLTLLATINGSPVGFSSLKGSDRIDMLYVHPAAAGQGVGTMLVDALERLAAARGALRLSAEVSDSAQEFFRHRGFVPQQRNSIRCGGEWLANTTMEKTLRAKEAAR